MKLNDNISYEIYNNEIYHLIYDDEYYLASTFMRLSSFYEKSDLQNKFFTLEECLDSQYTEFKKFDYYERWGAFNLPHFIIKRFWNMFHENGFLAKEERFFEILESLNDRFLNENSIYYVIGTPVKDNKSYFDHEFAHGLYCVNDEYKQACINLYEKCKCKKSLTKKLKSFGYADSVIIDEIQAYLGTSSEEYLKNELCLRTPLKTAEPFMKLYKKTKARYVS